MEVMLGEPRRVITQSVSQFYLRAYLSKNLRAGSLKVTLYVIRQDGESRRTDLHLGIIVPKPTWRSSRAVYGPFLNTAGGLQPPAIKGAIFLPYRLECPLTMRSPGARLFVTSLLALYAELLCIRWIPAYVRFISYFTNFILLASFLGLGVGILAARRTNRRSLGMGLTLFPWLLLAVVALVAISRFELRIESAGVLYYGASEGGAAPPESWVVLPAAFLLVSLVFVCLGRELGRLLAEVGPPLRAYALDVGGSIAGVAAFFFLSLTQQPPAVWFVGLLALMVLLTFPPLPWADLRATLRASRQLALIAPPLVIAGIAAHVMGSGFWWSPYYRVGITPMENHPTGSVLTVNTIGHQIMAPADEKEPFYYVPYDLFGLGTMDKAMIIGAGSGSDVAVALKYGQLRQVDAVEIDPVINLLGQARHPDKPFDDPRVRVHIDDGRSFLRKTGERYDLIIFALPDSLTLTSQLSSLRLESFLFTTGAMADARDRLTPDGALVLYNFYRETWLLRKIAGMMETSFGQPPYVVSYGGWGRAAVLVNGPRLQRLVREKPELARPYQEGALAQKRLEDDPNATLLPVIGTGVLAAGATGGFLDTASAAITPSLATDDWPLMYLPRPAVPGVYLAGLAMVAICALGLVLVFGGRHTLGAFDGHMFFLGAAFMLLETKSLVTFGLLFGNTWMVNSLVFFAILCSVLLAVYFSARYPVRPGPLTYGLLLATLLLAYALPESAFLSLNPPALRYAAASLVAFLPIFLANLVFAGSFKLTGRAADVAFASNLLGIMVGGMLEYAALLWGYRHLLLLAMAFYALSALLLRRPLSGVPGQARSAWRPRLRWQTARP